MQEAQRRVGGSEGDEAGLDDGRLDAIEPGALAVLARDGESRARKLLGVEAWRRMGEEGEIERERKIRKRTRGLG